MIFLVLFLLPFLSILRDRVAWRFCSIGCAVKDLLAKDHRGGFAGALRRREEEEEEEGEEEKEEERREEAHRIDAKF